MICSRAVFTVKLGLLACFAPAVLAVPLLKYVSSRTWLRSLGSVFATWCSQVVLRPETICSTVLSTPPPLTPPISITCPLPFSSSCKLPVGQVLKGRVGSDSGGEVARFFVLEVVGDKT